MGRKGGLAILWTGEVGVEIMNYSQQQIHTRIKSEKERRDCFLTGFYGHPKLGRKKETWNLLSILNHLLINLGVS